jgi:hypothetical protein
VTTTQLAEAGAIAAAGALLGTAAGSLVGLAAPAAIVAGLNGAISGWRGVYRWNSLEGVAAFVLDSSWALTTTAAGLASHAIGATRRQPRYSAALSNRQNRHVYEHGFQPRKGFAITLGNVISGAGDLSRSRRARLVTDHENVHVWQARGFGPLYPVLYAGWMTGGATIGTLLSVTKKRDEPFRQVVESCAYYLNPFEWWAYSRDDNWPPPGLLNKLGWTQPVVRSFTSLRRSARPESE